MTHVVICGKEVIYSHRSRDLCLCKSNWLYSGLQKSTEHQADMTRCVDCHILTDNWFRSASVKDMIPEQVGAGSLSATSIDQCPVLEEGQHWCWCGDPCIRGVLSLWERSRISNRNLQKWGEEGTHVDCIENTPTFCSEEGAWCFPCLVLCCECLVFLETGGALNFLRQGPVLLSVTGLDGSAYVVFSPATQQACSAD